MFNYLQTDVLIVYSICSCSQCDSKQTAFLVAFCFTEGLYVANCHCSICVCARVCVNAPACVDLAAQTPTWPTGFSVTLFSARGPSVPLLCWNAFWDIQLELQARGPAISQTYGLAPLHHAGLRRDSIVADGRIVIPVCSLMGPDSSL